MAQRPHSNMSEEIAGEIVVTVYELIGLKEIIEKFGLSRA